MNVNVSITLIHYWIIALELLNISLNLTSLLHKSPQRLSLQRPHFPLPLLTSFCPLLSPTAPLIAVILRTIMISRKATELMDWILPCTILLENGCDILRRFIIFKILGIPHSYSQKCWPDLSLLCCWLPLLDCSMLLKLVRIGHIKQLLLNAKVLMRTHVDQ